MIIASLQTAKQLTPELQNIIIRAIQISLENLSIDETAKIFAIVSRYASMGSEGDNKETKEFIQLKNEVTKHLSTKSRDMKMQDMLYLCMPLAAE